MKMLAGRPKLGGFRSPPLLLVADWWRVSGVVGTCWWRTGGEIGGGDRGERRAIKLGASLKVLQVIDGKAGERQELRTEHYVKAMEGKA